MKDLRSFLGSIPADSVHRDIMEQVVADLDSDYSPDLLQAMEEECRVLRRQIEEAKRRRDALSGTLRDYQAILDKVEAFLGEDPDVAPDIALLHQALRSRMEEVRQVLEETEPSIHLRQKYLVGATRRALVMRARAAACCRRVLYEGLED